MKHLVLAVALAGLITGSAHAGSSCPKMSKPESRDLANGYLACLMAAVIVEPPADEADPHGPMKRKCLAKQTEMRTVFGCSDADAEKQVRKSVRDRVGNSATLPPG